jgi:protein ImuB
MKHGQRILCIWLPDWPLERLAVARGELKGRPALLYDVQPRGGGLRVVAYAPRLAAPLAGASPASVRRPGNQRKTSRSAARRTAGIEPGLPLAEALALHEFFMLRSRQPLELHLEAHDPLADRLALVQLADQCQQFSPTVGLEESPRPDCLLLDVTGLAALLGGEAALAGQVGRALAERGFTAHLAVADTIGAAWAVAHYLPATEGRVLEPDRPVHKADRVDKKKRAEKKNGVEKSHGQFAMLLVPANETQRALAGLPLAALRLPAEMLDLLDELGIECVEQLCRLPRWSLHARFGPQLVRRLDQACGAAEEVIDAQRFAVELAAEWLLEHPTDRRETIETVLWQLLPRVVEPLAGQRKGVLELVCRLECEAGQPWLLPLGLFRATASVKHLFDMLRLRLESIWLDSPVAAVRVAVAAAGWLDLEQQQLFAEETQHASPRHLAGLVDRLTSRLGRQAVLKPVLLADAQPEHACQFVPLAQAASGQQRVKKPARVKGQRSADSQPGRTFDSGERPLRLHSPPMALAVMSVAPEGPPLRFCYEGREEQVARFWGPERIETGWWRTRCVRRDYYRVETGSGRRFWLFRQLHDGRWFLQGTFE